MKEKGWACFQRKAECATMVFGGTMVDRWSVIKSSAKQIMKKRKKKIITKKNLTVPKLGLAWQFTHQRRLLLGFRGGGLSDLVGRMFQVLYGSRRRQKNSQRVGNKSGQVIKVGFHFPRPSWRLRQS